MKVCGHGVVVGRPAKMHQSGVNGQIGFCHRSISSHGCRKAEDSETCMDLLSAFINIPYQYKAVLILNIEYFAKPPYKY